MKKPEKTIEELVEEFNEKYKKRYPLYKLELLQTHDVSYFNGKRISLKIEHGLQFMNAQKLPMTKYELTYELV